MDFKSGLRSAAAAAEIASSSVSAMIAQLGATDIRMVQRNDGSDYVHLISPEKNARGEEQYLTIKIGKKVVLSSTTVRNKLIEIINNYVVYYGKGENGLWFTFGPKPTMRETETFNIADLLKSGAVTLETAGS